MMVVYHSLLRCIHLDFVLLAELLAFLFGSIYCSETTRLLLLISIMASSSFVFNFHSLDVFDIAF
jgi:hypothetical protein